MKIKSLLSYWIKRLFDYKTNTIIQILSVGLVSCLVIYLFIYIGFANNVLTTTDNQFKLSVISTCVLGIFSVLAFYCVRKLEKSIRERVESFEEFIEKANKVLSDYSTSYRIMVIYPYFGLLKSVQKKIIKEAKKRGEVNIHEKLINHLKNNITTTFIVPDETSRKDFFDKIKSHPDKDEVEIKNNIDLLDWVDQWKRRDAKVYELKHENPLHMVISDRSVVWGSVGNPGECTGFYSSDTEVKSSFMKLFDCFLPLDRKE